MTVEYQLPSDFEELKVLAKKIALKEKVDNERVIDLVAGLSDKQRKLLQEYLNTND
jgi:hypothetical protein